MRHNRKTTKKTLPYTPFTYLIGWSHHQLFYYGVRYKQGASPVDLWTVYFTSSKYVSEAREMYGEPDIRQVRKTFKTAEGAIHSERRVLRRLKVVQRDDFLNKTDYGGYSRLGKKHTPEAIQKIINGSNKGCKRIITDEHRAALIRSNQTRILSEKHLIALTKKPCRPCTIDWGITVFPSRKVLVKKLGCGRSGFYSPDFRWVIDGKLVERELTEAMKAKIKTPEQIAEQKQSNMLIVLQQVR